MYEENMNGYFGHSNDSLFASADEMAGTYSPHNGNDGFTPVRETSAQPTSRRSNDRHSEDIEDMETNYPMPDEPEIWKQAEHPDSINKLLNITGDVCHETFRGAAKMLSHANPDTFEMPLEARFICMKVDRDSDMRYCLALGAVTNLPSCNDRINAVWSERNGQRVFMMFSISGQKEFCAMAEMLGPVGPGRMPGWSKPNCEGIILLTFIFVKNVPFALINHIKHKSNGQPVANMWNSMMYHDNTGYHVARIYCEHPVLSSVLVKIQTEIQVNYKSQLRIPTSGNTAYSASSYGSHNDKSYDPRSATRVNIHRSGNRGQKSTSSWWRNGIPPTPYRQVDQFYDAATHATPTPGVPHARGMHHHNIPGAAQSPPTFALPGSGSGATNTARSFTTADDRMLAEFANSRDAKRAEASQTPDGFQQVDASIHDPFQVGRTPHHGQPQTPSAINADWGGTSPAAHLGHHQSSPFIAQWQGSGRAAQNAVFSNNASTGLGITPDARGPSGGHGQQTMHTNERRPQLPSPNTSSQSSHHSSSPSNEVRRQKSQGFALRSPPSFNSMQFRRGHGHPVPQSGVRTAQGVPINPSVNRHQRLVKPESPIKHSQSMPVMIAQVAHRLSAQHLRALNTDGKTDGGDTNVPASPSIQDWVELTPTRGTVALAQQSPSTALTLRRSIDFMESPEKPVRSADLADRLKWHKAMAALAEVEIKMAEAQGLSPSEKRDMLKWHTAKVACYEVEIAAAHREHEEARGDLAKDTANHPPASPGTPQSSADWPKHASGSSIESDLITPEVDENGKILRSASKKREGKATHIGQKLRHRRGDIGGGGFTSSFDARMSANVHNLTSSPTRASAYVTSRATRTHGHPQQRTAIRPAHGMHDSCTEDQHCNEDERYHYDYIHNEDTCDFVSQVAAPEDDDEVFSPRGRGYHRSRPARDVSQISYNGGIELGDGTEKK